MSATFAREGSSASIVKEDSIVADLPRYLLCDQQHTTFAYDTYKVGFLLVFDLPKCRFGSSRVLLKTSGKDTPLPLPKPP